MSAPDDLTCAICASTFNDPTTLPCGHSYCVACVGEWFAACQRNGVSSTCPLRCRPQSLAVNVSLRSLANAKRDEEESARLESFSVERAEAEIVAMQERRRNAVEVALKKRLEANLAAERERAGKPVVLALRGDDYIGFGQFRSFKVSEAMKDLASRLTSSTFASSRARARTCAR